MLKQQTSSPQPSEGKQPSEVKVESLPSSPITKPSSNFIVHSHNFPITSPLVKTSSSSSLFDDNELPKGTPSLVPGTTMKSKDDELSNEWKLNKSVSSSSLINPSFTSPLTIGKTSTSSSHHHSHHEIDDDDDELPSFTPSMRPTIQSSSNTFLGPQTFEFQADSVILPPQSTSQILQSHHSSYVSEVAGYNEMSDNEDDDDDLLPDDDFPPAPTLIRQTGYYNASTCRSCSCLEPEERTDTEYI